MPITHSCYVDNFLNELATALETWIYFLQRFYLFSEDKCTHYGHTPILQALAAVRVPVTEPGTGSDTGAKFSSGRVLVYIDDTGYSIIHVP